jgi:hypothetical protein
MGNHFEKNNLYVLPFLLKFSSLRKTISWYEGKQQL